MHTRFFGFGVAFYISSFFMYISNRLSLKILKFDQFEGLKSFLIRSF